MYIFKYPLKSSTVLTLWGWSGFLWHSGKCPSSGVSQSCKLTTPRHSLQPQVVDDENVNTPL